MDKTICRLCLKESSQLLPIFNNNSDIYKALLQCTFIKISKSDEFSKYICNTCNKKLYNAYQFKKMCEASNNYLYQNQHLQKYKTQSTFKENIYACKKCGNKYSKKQQLQYKYNYLYSFIVSHFYILLYFCRIHMDYHNKKSIHKCSLCNFNTAYLINLWKHKYRSHSSRIFLKKYKSRKYICAICTQEYKSVFLLIKHRKSHLSEYNDDCTSYAECNLDVNYYMLKKFHFIYTIIYF